MHAMHNILVKEKAHERSTYHVIGEGLGGRVDCAYEAAVVAGSSREAE